MKEEKRRKYKRSAETKVNKYTRASIDGKEIHCPLCDYPTKVYHFSWSALTCYHCKEMVDKETWNLESDYETNQNNRK